MSKIKNKQSTKINQITVITDLLAAFLVLGFFFLITDAAEYLLTEKYWLLNSLSYKHTSLLFISLVILSCFLDWEKIIKKKNWVVFIFLSFFIVLFAHLQYSKFYKELQNYPKIKTISKDWGIKGSWVKISGRNFSDSHEQGKVYLDEQEMFIKKWSDKEIIFEIPLSADLGKHRVYVENHKQKRNQTVNSYQIRSI